MNKLRAKPKRKAQPASTAEALLVAESRASINFIIPGEIPLRAAIALSCTTQMHRPQEVEDPRWTVSQADHLFRSDALGTELRSYEAVTPFHVILSITFGIWIASLMPIPMHWSRTRHTFVLWYETQSTGRGRNMVWQQCRHHVDQSHPASLDRTQIPTYRYRWHKSMLS